MSLRDSSVFTSERGRRGGWKHVHGLSSMNMYVYWPHLEQVHRTLIRLWRSRSVGMEGGREGGREEGGREGGRE